MLLAKDNPSISLVLCLGVEALPLASGKVALGGESRLWPWEGFEDLS